MLQQLLKGAMEDQHLSTRELGDKLGISHTTVLRALHGDAVDLQTLIKIADWLNIRPSALLDTLGDNFTLDDKIEMLVQRYPALKDVLEKAVEAVENGLADPALIRDIVSYAEYRIQSQIGGKQN